MSVLLVIITILSGAIAAIMSLVAWQLRREERLRSEERVQALAADLADTPEDGSGPVPVGSLFVEEAPVSGARSLFTTALAGLLIFASLAAVSVALGRWSRSEATGTASSPGQTRPLELTSLDHRRDRDRLIVRGMVRDPYGAYGGTTLTAVVAVFDRAGALVATGDAAIELSPGVESSFAVTTAGAGDAYRYRVGFRSGGRTVSHLDRRHKIVTAELP
jgi:hypothetical protein